MPKQPTKAEIEGKMKRVAKRPGRLVRQVIAEPIETRQLPQERLDFRDLVHRPILTRKAGGIAMDAAG